MSIKKMSVPPRNLILIMRMDNGDFHIWDGISYPEHDKLLEIASLSGRIATKAEVEEALLGYQPKEKDDD